MKTAWARTCLLLSAGLGWVGPHLQAQDSAPPTSALEPSLRAERAVGSPPAGPTNITLDVPFVAQQKDTCAAAALAMLTSYWGRPVAQDDAARALLQRELQGILGSRLAEFARAHGFEALTYAGDLAHLREFLSKGRPLIVAWKLDHGRFHDVVVVGFDDARDLVLVNDPAVGSSREIARDEFERRWAGAGYWTLLVLPRAR